MKKRYFVLGGFVMMSLFIFKSTSLVSNVASPQPGNNGDPNTCSRNGCHNGPVNPPNVGDLTFKIGTGVPTNDLTSSFQYTPGTQYTLGFVINASAGRYGFQVSAADASNSQAGTFAVTDATNTKTSTAFGHTYIGHKDASTFKNWAFKWTAPAVGSGPVTFHYAYNLADGFGSPDNDNIYVDSVTIQELGTAISDIADKISELSISPNPVSNELHVSFELKESNNIEINLYSLDGSVSKNLVNCHTNNGLFSENSDLENLPSGIYFLKVSVGNSSTTQKILKL